MTDQYMREAATYLYSEGWKAADREWIKEEYGLTEYEADYITNQLELIASRRDEK